MASFSRVGRTVSAGDAARRASQKVVCHGARATEAALVDALLALAAETRREPRLLRLPVLVVVPSRSLRLHVSARLVAAAGGAVAGTLVRTLYGLALSVLDRSGETVPGGGALFPILVRRAAAAEPLLAGSLAHLRNGWGGLAATVRDLLDAGFDDAHAEGVDELLAELGDDPPVVRARAVVRVAARLALEARRLGVARREWVLQRAAELVWCDPERSVPSRAVLVHGFAEATGVASDLLEALVARCPTTVFLDEPPDPASPLAVDAGAAFTERLRERLGRHAPEVVHDAQLPPPRLAAVQAATVEEEVRLAAVAIRGLLDAGARPEGIGLVARALDPYTVPVARHFGRLGIPFSGLGARGSLTPAGRWLAALLELLGQGGEATVDAWLLAEGLGDELLVDLGLGLRACGATRLADVAALPVDALLAGGSALPLPVRRGVALGEDDDGEEGRAYVRRRRLAGDVLQRAVRRAAAVIQHLSRWPADAPLAVHRAHLAGLAVGSLGRAPWGSFKGGEELAAAVARLEADVPGRISLVRDEFLDLLAGELAEAGRAPLGGEGGGVQLLAVMEARGRTFEHLWLVGLDRDLFPRPVREDPLLPDGIRAALKVVLPDLAVKAAGFDEERYLFAQLVSASPDVTLSWHGVGADGRAASPSPLLSRILAADVLHLPERGGARVGAAAGPATAFEHAVATGGATDRERFAAVLALARREVDPSERVPSLPLARLRRAVLDILDPVWPGPTREAGGAALAPYLGFVGAAAPRDLRGQLHATLLRTMVECPWATFLGQVLRLEPPPDPLAALPSVDARTVGAVVHAVLEGVCRAAAPELPRTLEEALATAPVHVPWPAAEALEALLDRAAVATAREEGLLWPGLQLVLEERARPFLEVARQLEWRDGVLSQVCGVEVEGAAELSDQDGRRWVVRFRADRVDRRGEGVVCTDYKTGAAPSLGERDSTRRARVLDRIRGGAFVQGALYAVALPSGAVGRYLFLGARQEEAAREVTLEAEHEDVVETLKRVVATVGEAWRAGVFVPRLVEPERDVENRRCEACPYKPACLRGDSGVRRRLRAWAEASAGQREERDATGVMLALWWLPARPVSEHGHVGGEGE